MVTDVVTESLAALTRCVDDDERIGYLRREQRVYLERPDQAALLVRHVAEASPTASLEDALALLAGVLDEARMADENGLPPGTELLRTVAGELERLAAAGALGAAARFALAQAYVRAGLAPPQALKLSGALEGEPGHDEPTEPGLALGELLDRVCAELGADPQQLHAGLTELLATLPVEAQAVAITEIAALPQANFSRLGAYWLLNPATEIRQAAAAIFLGRVRTCGLSGIERARLLTVRKWLPADPARALVDEALREALRRDPATAPEPAAPWKLHRLSACLPDGAGAQSVVVAAQQGKRRAVAMLLLKDGHGVKDAFVVPCGSAAEQKRLLAQVIEQTDPLDVDVGYVRDAIGRALSDGAAQGHLPAPGLVDVAEMIGGELAPEAYDAASVIAAIDPDGTLATLSPREMRALLGESAGWPQRYALVDTWFEDTGEVREFLDHGGSVQARRAKLWRHLEGRRPWWAMTFARAAALMHAARDADGAWRAFAATVLALIDGRPLKTIPIMETVVAQTLEASEHRRSTPSETWDGHDPEIFEGPKALEFVAPEPEKPGELDAYLASGGLTTAWLEGWLVAIAVAPKFEKPSTWLGALLGRLAFADHEDLQRFLDLLMARMNAANANVAREPAVAQTLQAMSADERSQWAAGFSAFVDGYPSAWPKRGRTRDDQAMLAHLRQGEQAGIEPSLVGLLSTWISQRRARRA